MADKTNTSGDSSSSGGGGSSSGGGPRVNFYGGEGDITFDGRTVKHGAEGFDAVGDNLKTFGNSAAEWRNYRPTQGGETDDTWDRFSAGYTAGADTFISLVRNLGDLVKGVGDGVRAMADGYEKTEDVNESIAGNVGNTTGPQAVHGDGSGGGSGGGGSSDGETHGSMVEKRYVDENGEPVLSSSQGVQYVDENGEPISLSGRHELQRKVVYVDQNGTPVPSDRAVEVKYVDENGKPIETPGIHAIQYVDENGKPIPNDRGGDVSYVDDNGKPVEVSNSHEVLRVDQNGQPVPVGGPEVDTTPGSGDGLPKKSHEVLTVDQNGQPVPDREHGNAPVEGGAGVDGDQTRWPTPMESVPSTPAKEVSSEFLSDHPQFLRNAAGEVIGITAPEGAAIADNGQRSHFYDGNAKPIGFFQPIGDHTLDEATGVLSESGDKKAPLNGTVQGGPGVGSSSGGNTPGGSSSGDGAGSHTPGGNAPGGTSAGDPTGSDSRGGNSAGGTSPGGNTPGGNAPGGTSAGDPTGGNSPGGTAGSHSPGGGAGSHSPGGVGSNDSSGGAAGSHSPGGNEPRGPEQQNAPVQGGAGVDGDKTVWPTKPQDTDRIPYQHVPNEYISDRPQFLHNAAGDVIGITAPQDTAIADTGQRTQFHDENGRPNGFFQPIGNHTIDEATGVVSGQGGDSGAGGTSQGGDTRAATPQGTVPQTHAGSHDALNAPVAGGVGVNGDQTRWPTPMHPVPATPALDIPPVPQVLHSATGEAVGIVAPDGATLQDTGGRVQFHDNGGSPGGYFQPIGDHTYLDAAGVPDYSGGVQDPRAYSPMNGHGTVLNYVDGAGNPTNPDFFISKVPQVLTNEFGDQIGILARPDAALQDNGMRTVFMDRNGNPAGFFQPFGRHSFEDAQIDHLRSRDARG